MKLAELDAINEIKEFMDKLEEQLVQMDQAHQKNLVNLTHEVAIAVKLNDKTGFKKINSSIETWKKSAIANKDKRLNDALAQIKGIQMKHLGNQAPTTEFNRILKTITDKIQSKIRENKHKGE